MDSRLLLALGIAFFSLSGCFGEVDPAGFAAEAGPSLADKPGADRLLWLFQQSSGSSFGGPRTNVDAYIEDMSAGQVTRLSNSPGDESEAMLSPDRRYLLFTSTDLIVMNLRNGVSNRLTVGMSCRQPRWKSDSSEILFVGRKKNVSINTNAPVSGDIYGKADLFLVDRRWRSVTNLTNTPNIDEYGPDWLNDDSAVVCIAKLADESSTVQVLSLSGSGKTTVPLNTSDYGRILAVAWSDKPRTVTVLLDGTPREFVEVNIDSGDMEKLGTIDGHHPVRFDRCESTGRFALATWITVSSDQTSFRAGIPPPVMQAADSAVWSHDSKFLTYGKSGFPIGFLDGLKQGHVVALKDKMATVDKNGDVELFPDDDFYEYTPVVQKIIDPVTGVERLENLSRAKALRLLEPKGAWLIHHWNLEELPWKLKADEEMHAIMSK